MAHSSDFSESCCVLQWASVDAAGPSTDAKEGMFRRLWSLKEVHFDLHHASHSQACCMPISDIVTAQRPFLHYIAAMSATCKDSRWCASACAAACLACLLHHCS